MAIGCGNGNIKVLSVAQGTPSAIQKMYNISSKDKTVPP